MRGASETTQLRPMAAARIARRLQLAGRSGAVRRGDPTGSLVTGALCLPCLFFYEPKVVLGVLVEILGFDCVAGQGGRTRQRHVPLVARFRTGTLVGPSLNVGRFGSAWAGSKEPSVVSSIGVHGVRNGPNMVGPK